MHASSVKCPGAFVLFVYLNVAHSQGVVDIVDGQLGALSVSHKFHSLLNNFVNPIFDILREGRCHVVLEIGNPYRLGDVLDFVQHEMNSFVLVRLLLGAIVPVYLVNIKQIENPSTLIVDEGNVLMTPRDVRVGVQCK